MDSLCHPWFTTTNLSYRFRIFETSATALCGTTGIAYGPHRGKGNENTWMARLFQSMGVLLVEAAHLQGLQFPPLPFGRTITLQRSSGQGSASSDGHRQIVEPDSRRKVVFRDLASIHTEDEPRGPATDVHRAAACLSRYFVSDVVLHLGPASAEEGFKTRVGRGDWSFTGGQGGIFFFLLYSAWLSPCLPPGLAAAN